MVFGDITQFTVERTEIIKAALSLGTAVSTSIGYAHAKPGKTVFCISGDCSFLHEGIGIIDEAIIRGIQLCIVVIDNGGSWCTGGQCSAGQITRILDHPKLLKLELTYEGAEEEQIKAALQQMVSFKGVSIMRLGVPMGTFLRKDNDNE